MRRRAADADRHRFELVEGSHDLDDDLDDGSDDLVLTPSPGDRGVAGPGAAGSGLRRGGVIGPDLLSDDNVLADDPGDGSEPAAAGSPPPDADPVARAVTRRRRRRTVLASAVAAVVVLGGMATVDAVVTRGDRARLSAAPGGILSAAQAPETIWEQDVDQMSASVSFLPGAVVVVDEDEAVGRDLDSGAEVWRHTFDEPSYCGATASWYIVPSVRPEQTLVCIPGQSGYTPEETDEGVPMTVTHLAADGSVLATLDVDRATGPDPGSTDLRDVRWQQVSPGAEGALLWVGRAGPEPEGQGDVVEIDPATGFPEGIGAASDMVVALQDVDTGDVRWHATVEAQDEQDTAFSCVLWQNFDGGEAQEGEVDLDQSWASASGGAVNLQGCGVTATLSAADGARLDDPDRAEDQVMPFDDGFLRDVSGGAVLYGGASGLFDASGDPLRSSVLDAEGAEVWRAPGLVFPPAATDGTSELWFSNQGAELAAVDHGGEPQWTWEPEGTVDRVLVATRDVVVVPRSNGLTALDGVTGRELWSFDDVEDLELSALGLAQQAFTDGRTAVFLTDTGSGPRLTGVDLTDGRVVWTSDASEGYWNVVAVEGRLVQLGEHSVARLG